MERVKVNVIVEGPLKCGRTTITQVIERALKTEGFEVENKDADAGAVSFPLDARIVAIRERSSIDIVPMQRQREGELRLLRDELKPHFDAIYAALAKKGGMPRAVDARTQVARAFVCVTLVDTREKYLKETLTYVPGTICIYLEGDLHRPIRKRVLRVTAPTENRIVTDWHDPRKPERIFDHDGVQMDSLRDHQAALDKIDPIELRALLTTAQVLWA